ncbi:MAG: phosphate acyltransferase PlsX [Pseudomonadota bacterium]|nr:phosphate acyltransferase PlsX [Pseudomonadota bacterium]
MATDLTIALDVMGGDHGAPVVIPGAAVSLERHPDSRYLLVGDKARIEPELDRHRALADRSQIIHTDVAVAMDEKPSQALRKGRWKSSMWLAIQAVRDGQAQAVVSAGNTGALMAMAKFCLRTLPGIERPAIAAVWPTIDAECIVLDVGANVGADARQLIEFSLMGAAMARALFSLENPTVGLLNIGVEEIKGLEEIRKASQALRSMDVPFDYRGFIEGNNVGQGVVDVVVTEGFTGNIALKTAEGTARQIGTYLKAAMNRSLISRIGAVLARGAFEALKEKMDPRELNGGVFLGLNGIAIKSHGGTDAMGFASAIDVGYDMARSGLIERLAKDILQFQPVLELGRTA